MSDVEQVNGQIYRIYSESTDLVYIGSTTKTLSDRFSQHKCDYSTWQKGSYPYVTSFAIFKIGNAKIELIENFTCNDVKELRKREGEIIKTTPNCVNKQIAGRTSKEYYIDHREKLLEKSTRYYDVNRDTVKEKVTKYQEANRDKINKKHAQYYQKNKDKINQKFDCACGGRYTHGHSAHHFKTKKHQDYLTNQKN